MKNNETLINEFLENKNPSEEIENLLKELKSFKSFMHKTTVDLNITLGDDYYKEDLNKQEQFRKIYLKRLIKINILKKKLTYVKNQIFLEKQLAQQRMASYQETLKQYEKELYLEKIVIGWGTGTCRKENKLIQELILLGAKTKKELDKEKSIA